MTTNSTTSPSDISAVAHLAAASYLDCGSTVDVSFQGRNPWTFEGWVLFAGLCPNSLIVSKPGEFEFGTQGKKVYAKRSPQIGPVSSDDVLDTIDWFHLAVTFDGTTMTLYVNGVPAGFVNVYDEGVSNKGQNFQLGPGLQGDLDSFRIWNVCVPADLIYTGQWEDYPAGTQGLLRQYDFSSVPPRETSGNNAPPSFKKEAVQVINAPGLFLTDSAYVDPYDDGGVNPGGGGNDSYTVLAWIHQTSTTEQQCIFSNGDAAGTTGINLFVDGGVVKARRGGQSGTLLASRTTLQPDTWYSIGYTYDGANQAIVINGLPDAQAAAPAILEMPEGIPLIGAAYSSLQQDPTMFFQGYIQFVSVWKVALSPAQIQSWMYNDPTNEAEVVANYGFSVAPAQNLTNGNPVGLVGGARLDVLETVATASAPRPKRLFEIARPPRTPRTEVGKDCDGSFQTVDPFHFFEPWSEEHRLYLVAELERALPPALPAALRRRMVEEHRARVDQIFDAAQSDPDSAPFRIDREIVGDHHVLTYRRGDEAIEIWRAPVTEVSDCTAWYLQLLATVAIGFFFVFGFTIRDKTMYDFFGNRINDAIGFLPQFRRIFNAPISPQTFLEVFRLLWEYRMVTPLLGVLWSGISYWTILNLALRIAGLLFPASSSLQVAYFLTQVAQNVQSVVAVWNQKPAGC